MKGYGFEQESLKSFFGRQLLNDFVALPEVNACTREICSCF